jgi:septal ring factor EnvC (AmiA/AmiB activator)
MMQHLEEDSNKIVILENKITSLEEELDILHHMINQQHESIMATQQYLVKLAQSQNDLGKKISAWPFVRVPSETKKKQN